jgi:hypothetical protein
LALEVDAHVACALRPGNIEGIQALEPEVSVPAKATGVVYVPAERVRDVAVRGGLARLIGREHGRVVYELDSGRHSLRVLTRLSILLLSKVRSKALTIVASRQ